MLTQNETDHVFNQLESGLVPERGLEALAVGVEKPRAELIRQLEFVQNGSGAVKFLRGGYGCGKTFMSRLAIADAHAREFATSFVVVSDNDLRFHRFDEVYRKVVTELATAGLPARRARRHPRSLDRPRRAGPDRPRPRRQTPRTSTPRSGPSSTRTSPPAPAARPRPTSSA